MGRILIKGGLLIDGKGGAPIVTGAVLIEGPRIVGIGKAEAFQGCKDAKVLDCGDQTLLPGLIDCHNHLSLDPRLDDYLHRMTAPIPAMTLRACETMKIDLRSGVTTSRCMGDRGFLDVECKKAVEAGRIEGPRLIVATRGIRAFHGHGFVGYPFGGPDQIRDAVRENILAGADLIKIFITGTLRGPKGIFSYFSKEEIRTAVDEAHRAGLSVATHCIGGTGLEWALETGIDVIEHGYYLTEPEIDLFVKSGRWLVMTPASSSRTPGFGTCRRTLSMDICSNARRSLEAWRPSSGPASPSRWAPMPCMAVWPRRSNIWSISGRRPARR
jgi:imidazolonepropionase-like amidohydrolase